jgi:hypothetical protein
MPIETVTVQFVNPPKGKGPANINVGNKRYMKFWTRDIPASSFRKGGTYKVAYHVESSEEYGNQEYIDEVLSGQTQTNAAGVPASAAMTPNKDEIIGGLALAKLSGPLPVGDVAAYEHAFKAGIMAYRRVMAWLKTQNIETSKSRAAPEEELNDQIPY